MIRRNNLWVYGIVIFSIFGLGAAIAFGIIPLGELPSQFYGALVGTVITAIITILLLQGQTQTEENKERNVKVFEKKSEVFNNFIEKLWEIWEDRSVSLEELNELLKLVAKDIIPYANSENSEVILKELNLIAEKASPLETDSSNPEHTNKIQESIFNIINILSKEIGLGGEIKPKLREDLGKLEKKILPFLNKKSNISSLVEQVKIQSKGELSEFQKDEQDILWWKIGNRTGVWIRVGDIPDGRFYITFWSDFYSNRQYQDYRHSLRGEWKDWFAGSEEIKKENFNYNDLKNGEVIPQEKIKDFAKTIVDFYNNQAIKGKTITDIIEEVKNN